MGFYFHWHWILMLYYNVVLISLGFWWLALHEFKKFQIFVIFALYKNQGCYRLPPLKEISSRDLGRLERKIGLGNLAYTS